MWQSILIRLGHLPPALEGEVPLLLRQVWGWRGDPWKKGLEMNTWSSALVCGSRIQPACPLGRAL